MVWALNTIKKWLVTPVTLTFVPLLLNLSFRKVSVIDPLVCRCVILMVAFLFWNLGKLSTLLSIYKSRSEE